MNPKKSPAPDLKQFCSAQGAPRMHPGCNQDILGCRPLGPASRPGLKTSPPPQQPLGQASCTTPKLLIMHVQKTTPEHPPRISNPPPCEDLPKLTPRINYDIQSTYYPIFHGWPCKSWQPTTTLDDTGHGEISSVSSLTGFRCKTVPGT